MADDTKTTFTEQYAPAAIRAAAALGVAPSVLVGQWGLETGWGKSVIPGTNNLGNIKDFSGGGVAARDNATGSDDRYRAFATPDDFADHYVDLIKRKYPDAINAPDATAYANALKAGGYAGDPQYVRKVVGAQMAVPKSLIERTMDAMVGSASAAEPQTGQAPNPFAADAAPQGGPDYSSMSDDQLRALAGGAVPQQPAQQQPDYPKMSDEQLLQLAGPQAAPDKSNIGGRVVQGLRSPVDAGAQLLTHVLPNSFVDAVNSGAQWLNENIPITKTLGITPATSKQLDQGIAQREREYQASRGYHAGTFDPARVAGEMAATAPLMLAGGAPAGLVRAAGTGAAYGAAGGALTPVTDENADYGDTKLGQIASGAIGGAVAGPVADIAGRGVARVLSPSVRPEVQALLDEGVTPTPGQILGPRAARAEEALTSYPFLGGGIRNARERAVEDLNDAAIRRATLAGDVAPSVAQGNLRGALDTVQGNLSRAYDDLLPRITVRMDPQLGSTLNAIEQAASTLPVDQANRFTAVMNRTVGNSLTQNGSMSGRAFKTVESSLRQEISAAGQSPDPYTRMMADHLRDVRNALRDSLQRTNPQYAPQLRAINQAWANYSILRRAGAKVANPDSPMTVAGLQSAVKANNNTVGKGGFATGTALMQDLTDPAVSVLGNKVPNSGTADRGLLGMLGLGYISPTALGMGAVGNLLYTRAAQRALAALLTQRPELARTLAGIVRQESAPIGGLLSGQAAADLSNRPN
ncbi:UNVERIFIED_ORG: mannosyl-glycoprotein endo-beta-N-acetylglucosaminidase [Burkholderia sp. CF145]